MAAKLPKTDDSYVQMVILTADRQKEPLTWLEAYHIEKYIFSQVCAVREKRPRFKGRYEFSKEDGAIIINTHVDSVSWLKEVVGSYKKKVLRITDIKNSPQYTAKVVADVRKLNWEVLDNLLDLLEAHNVGLKTDGWRIISFKEERDSDDYDDKKVTYAMILIDDSGRKMLKKNGFLLNLGFSTITFKVLGRVKRSEITGVICDHYTGFQGD